MSEKNYSIKHGITVFSPCCFFDRTLSGQKISFGGLGDNSLYCCSLYPVVFKILQNFPLGIKGLVFQILYASVLFALVFALNWSWLAFLTGFLFSQIYMILFFSSVSFLFHQKERKLGLILMFAKWLFLLCVFAFALGFLEGKAFLIGLSGLLSFMLSFVLEHLKRSRKYTDPV